MSADANAAGCDWFSPDRFRLLRCVNCGQSRDTHIANTAQAAEIAALKAQRDTSERVIFDPYPQVAGENMRLREEVEHLTAEKGVLAAENAALKAEVERKDKALEPFAAVGEAVLAEAPPEGGTITVFVDCEGEGHCVTTGDFRRARAALQPKEEDDGL